MFTKAFFTAAACGLLANAHMVINTPVPYGQDSLNNSPLAADGSDFPCKQRSGVYDVTKMNNIAVGSPQSLAFTGGATHGGGSCQLSITMDKEPTKSSSWKVIHSIEGGCPSNDTGNASEDASYKGATVFTWEMPAGMPNGQYTLAWTWFNKIGNREMYMNCAPITVTGGSDSKDAMNALPDMFEANIGDGCTTVEGEDLEFPSPGKFVEKDGSALGTSLVGACGAAATGYGGGSGSGSASSPASSSAAAPTSYGGGGAASSPAAGSSSAAAPTGYGSGSGSGSGSGGGSSTATTMNIVTVTTMATVTGGGAAPTGYGTGSSSGSSSASGSSSGSGSGSGSSGTSSGGSSTGKVACTTQNEIMCMGSDSFGLCDNGFAVPQKLATGTSCSGGVIQKRSDSIRHLRRRKMRSSHHAGVF